MSKFIIEALKELSRANHDPKFPPPAFEDLPKLRADTEQQLRFCNGELMRLESLLETFYIQREKLETQLDLIASLHAPIRRLPVPLLQDVLVETTSPKLSPGVLSHVCSHWRNVVFDCPTLWSELDLSKKIWHRPDSRMILDEIMSRTRTCPLSITIAESDQLNSRPALQLLSLTSERWTALNVSIAGLNAFDEISQSKGLPRLEHFSLIPTPISTDAAHWPSPPTPEIAPFKPFHQAPMLMSAALTTIHPHLVELPWERLVKLDLNSVSFSYDDLHVLSECHQLRFLKLRGCSTMFRTDSEPPKWGESITNLDIDPYSMSRNSIPQCHRLVSLHLGNRSRSSWGSRSHERELIPRELKQVFTLYGAHIQTLSLNIPSFKLLSLLGEGLPSSLAQASSTPPMLLPNLKQLDFGSMDGESADKLLERLLLVLCWRRQTGFERVKLRFLLTNPPSLWGMDAPSLDPATYPLPIDVALLRSLVKRGIQVMLMHERLRNPWSTSDEIIDTCNVWHVLESEGVESQPAQTCGLGCHFVKIPHCSGPGNERSGRRWNHINWWRYRG